MTTPTTKEAVIKVPDEKLVEYVPFGAQDKIKLSIGMVKNLIAVKTKSGKTCSDNDAIKFMAMCHARRLNPWEGDAFLIGYDGKDGPQFSLITAHQAFLKRAELNAEYDGMKSGVIIEREGSLLDLEGDFYLEGDKVLGGWATVHFKNRKQPMHKRIRMQRFKKPFGIWLEDAAGMIVKCAEADALRSSFPTMLGGLYLREEVLQTQPEAKTSTPIFSVVTPNGITTPPPQPTDIEKVRELLTRANITEKDLIEFCTAIGVADEGMTTLEQVALKYDTALGMIQENWTDFSERIKGEKQ